MSGGEEIQEKDQTQNKREKMTTEELMVRQAGSKRIMGARAFVLMTLDNTGKISAVANVEAQLADRFMEEVHRITKKMYKDNNKQQLKQWRPA